MKCRELWELYCKNPKPTEVISLRNAIFPLPNDKNSFSLPHKNLLYNWIRKMLNSCCFFKFCFFVFFSQSWKEVFNSQLDTWEQRYWSMFSSMVWIHVNLKIWYRLIGQQALELSSSCGILQVSGQCQVIFWASQFLLVCTSE